MEFKKSDVSIMPMRMQEEEPDGEFAGTYIGITDDFHEYEDAMKSIILRHKSDIKMLERLLSKEKDGDIRTDYEIDIRRARNYIERNEKLLESARQNRERSIFYMTHDRCPGFETVPEEYKKIHDSERREFLVLTYA